MFRLRYPDLSGVITALAHLYRQPLNNAEKCACWQVDLGARYGAWLKIPLASVQKPAVPARKSEGGFNCQTTVTKFRLI